MKSIAASKRLKFPLLLAAVAFAAPAFAATQGACTKWDISKPWSLVHGVRVDFKIGPGRTAFTGTAAYSLPDEYARDQWNPVPALGYNVNARLTAAISGTIRGDSIVIYTQYGGVYGGKIDAAGKVSGVAYFKGAPDAKANWNGFRTVFDCLERAAATPAPVPTTGAACKSGYVWREARPADFVCVTPQSRTRVAEENRTAATRVIDRERGGVRGKNICKPGFVWREAFDGDVVCVTPAIRALVGEENRLAPIRVASR